MAKKIFNEKKYQKNRKTLNIIGISWIIGVVIVSIILISIGAYNANKAKNTLTEAIDATTQATTTLPDEFIGVAPDVSEQPYDLSDYTGPKTYEELDAAVAAIEAQYAIAMGESGWYEDQKTKNTAISDVNRDFQDYSMKNEANISWLSMATDVNEQQETNVDVFNDVSTMSKGVLSNFSSMSDLAIGGMSLIGLFGALIAMIFCCMPGFALLFVANSRVIYGFVAQSSVPVAKESTEQMSPAFGTVARDITKGIKSGLADNKKVSSKKKRK